MEINQKTFATIKSALPPELFVRREGRFLLSVAQAVTFLAACTWLSALFIPLKLWALPLWIIYALVNGTFAVGVWVLAHECGHGAMSSRKWLNDFAGYPLHTFLLVPYFSWQYSHSVHHSRTNHLFEDESYVPFRRNDPMTWYQKHMAWMRGLLGGDDAFSIYFLAVISLVGWPMYLLIGASGGAVRGATNHFVPSEKNKLFPRSVWWKVWLSTVGIIVMLTFLGYMCHLYGVAAVAALYIGPYLVCNGWLVLYTYLHHTDENTPHYDEKAWNWTKGALCSIERNYPEFINWLHFDIGSSHVVHHLFSALPHYNARKARAILERAFPDFYRVDKRTLYQSLVSTAKTCLTVTENPYRPGEWNFTKQD